MPNSGHYVPHQVLTSFSGKFCGAAPGPGRALPFAELDAEAAAGVVPFQGTRGGDGQAGPALEAGGVLDGDGPVGFLGVDVGRAAGDYGLAGSGGPGDLLVDLDVTFLLVKIKAVLRQALRDGQWFHSARAPAMPSRTSCLIFTGDWVIVLRATLRRCRRGWVSRLKAPYRTSAKSSPYCLYMRSASRKAGALA